MKVEWGLVPGPPWVQVLYIPQFHWQEPKPHVALGFSVFLGTPYFPGSAPILVVSSGPGKLKVEGVEPYVLPRMA